MFDIAVIGSGPAGLSAAVNACARNKTVAVLGHGIATSALYKAANVDNYLGMPGITGEKMLNEYYGHAMKMGVKFINGKVLQILKGGKAFNINSNNEFFEAKAIIIATGVSKSKQIKGEEKYTGLGVSYCATCDGMFFRNKTVTVVAENIDAIEDANFLKEICNTVYFVSKKDFDITGLTEGIITMTGTPTEIVGDEVLTGIIVDDSVIKCDGVFFINEVTPMSSLIHGLDVLDGAITVNRLMETNIDGVFAAGDCVGKPYQVAKAVGEGLIAAQQAVKYTGSL